MFFLKSLFLSCSGDNEVPVKLIKTRRNLVKVVKLDFVAQAPKAGQMLTEKSYPGHCQHSEAESKRAGGSCRDQTGKGQVSSAIPFLKQNLCKFLKSYVEGT